MQRETLPNLGIIEKLASGYSNIAKIANQFWLTLMIFSMVAMISKHNENNQLRLPFGLGEANTSDFYAISLVVICILVIAFTSTMIQSIRIRKLIQLEIDSIEEKDKYISKIHIQDFVDSILSPTFNKVAPISQFLLGNDQFLSKERPKIQHKRIPVVFYLLLKITGFVFIYLIPLYSIFLSFSLINPNESSIIFFHRLWYFPFMLISISAIFILIIADFNYVKKVLIRLRQ